MVSVTSDFVYLLDEHVNPLLKKGLNEHWPDIPVFRIGAPGAPPLSTLDPEILEWCVANNAILVTNNRASMPVHLKERMATGQHVNGIIVMNDKLLWGEIIEELATIWLATSLKEHINLIRYLPISSWD